MCLFRYFQRLLCRWNRLLLQGHICYYNQKILSVADDLLFIPETDALFAGVIEIVPLQLLAYYVAKENNCDIDKPKNLAKSVTVE